MCLALLPVLAGTAGKALAQSSVFYNEPSGEQQQELKQWGTMYLELLDNGTPAEDAASFAFTKADMNSALFSPVRAAMSIVGEAIGQSGCATTTTIQPGGGGTIDENLVAYLTLGKITTSLANTDATTAHLTAIMNGNNAQFTIENNVLVSEGLTPSVIATVPGAKQYTTVSNATATWISQLGTLSPGWAAQRNFADEGKRQLLGMVSEVEVFEGQIRDWATVNGVELTVYRVVANFGAYGSLPIFVGVYQSGSDAGFILIDGVNGEVDGPFVSGSAIDPRGLLVLHGGAFVSGTGVQVVDAETGKCAPVAKEWEDSPPWTWPWDPAYVPTWPAPAPVVPGVPAAPFTPWSCYQQGTHPGLQVGLACVCILDGTSTGGGTPPTVPTRIICRCGGIGCAAPGGPPSGPNGPGTIPNPADPTAPNIPGGPTPGTTTPVCSDCREQWFF
jgi:hypothetical protein